MGERYNCTMLRQGLSKEASVESVAPGSSVTLYRPCDLSQAVRAPCTARCCATACPRRTRCWARGHQGRTQRRTSCAPMQVMSRVCGGMKPLRSRGSSSSGSMHPTHASPLPPSLMAAGEPGGPHHQPWEAPSQRGSINISGGGSGGGRRPRLTSSVPGNEAITPTCSASGGPLSPRILSPASSLTASASTRLREGRGGSQLVPSPHQGQLKRDSHDSRGGGGRDCAADGAANGGGTHVLLPGPLYPQPLGLGASLVSAQLGVLGRLLGQSGPVQMQVLEVGGESLGKCGVQLGGAVAASDGGGWVICAGGYQEISWWVFRARGRWVLSLMSDDPNTQMSPLLSLMMIPTRSVGSRTYLCKGPGPVFEHPQSTLTGSG